MKNWRTSKTFKYGYLPFRLVFWALAYVCLALTAGFAAMCWLQPATAREVWRRAQ